MAQEVVLLAREEDVLEVEGWLELLGSQKTLALDDQQKQNQLCVQSGGGRTCSPAPQLSKDHITEGRGRVCWHPLSQKQT